MIHKPLPQKDLEAIASSTHGIWSSNQSFSLFLTGATGFIGTWLLESLDYIQKKYELTISVTALSRDPESFLNRMPHLSQKKWIRWVRSDLKDFTIQAQKFDYIIHAAAETNQRANESVAINTISGMYHGTEKVLSIAKSCSTRSILFTSSGAVYGRRIEEGDAIKENQSCCHYTTDLKSSYGIGKLISEHMLSAFGADSGCNIAIARCFAFVGPHLPLNQNFAIGNFIRDALAKKPITLQSDGTAVRSYLYAADLTIWLWKMLFKCQGVEIINVGSAEAITILDLVKLVADMYDIPFHHVANPSPSTPSFYYPCTDLAWNHLELSPYTNLREGIQKTYQWYLNTP